VRLRSASAGLAGAGSGGMDHRAKPGAELIEYVCLENQRNPVNDKGEIGVILAPNKP
jgi:hypothetical protein